MDIASELEKGIPHSWVEMIVSDSRRKASSGHTDRDGETAARPNDPGKERGGWPNSFPGTATFSACQGFDGAHYQVDKNGNERGR